MVKVGIAGIGFMGMIHYLAYQKVRGVKVVAICETDAKRLAGDWRGIKGNFGPRGQKMDLKGIARYAKIADMLADPNVDMVDVCLPPLLHKKVSIDALKAGKHVFCEKPIALNPADAKDMVGASKKAKKQLIIGHVLPLFPEYNFAYQAVTSGKYGKLLGGHFKRIISDPLWLPGYYNPKSHGGPMLDLRVHDAHFIRLLFGMPKAVFSVGAMRGKVVERFTSQFQYANPKLVVTATCGVINQQGRPFTHAYEIYLEKATILFDAAGIGKDWVVGYAPTLLDSKGKVVKPKFPPSEPTTPFVEEIKEVVKTLRSGRPSKLLDGSLARDAVILCEKQTASVKSRRAVKV